MAIFDIDFSKAGQRLTPPDKRYPKMNAWIKAFLSPIQWLVDLWFKEFRTGSTAQQWLSTSTYPKYGRVINNTIVYESLINGNTAPTTDITAWQIVQKNFIGLSERILYTGNTLTLTFALNKRFMTIFRQPPNISDIFISNNDVGVFPFIIGARDSDSSDVFRTTSSDFVIDSYSFTGRFNFSINMPTAVYNALDPIPTNCEKIVRAFVDKYLPSGITYNITLI